MNFSFSSTCVFIRHFFPLPLGEGRVKVKTCSLNFWSRVFQDIKPALDAVRNVNQTVRIDIKVVEHGCLLSFRRRWNEVAHFLRTELVSDVEDAETRIIISNKNNVLALE